MKVKTVCPKCGSINSFQLMKDELYNIEPIMIGGEVKIIKYPLRRIQMLRCRGCGEIYVDKEVEHFISYYDPQKNNKFLYIPSDLYNQLTEKAKKYILNKFQKIECIGGDEDENIES